MFPNSSGLEVLGSLGPKVLKDLGILEPRPPPPTSTTLFAAGSQTAIARQIDGGRSIREVTVTIRSL